MLTAVQNFIPVLTSEAGLCLTTQNWQEAKVTAAAYSLEFLLHKPGVDLLKKIPDLAHYLGWSGVIVLNAMALVANKEGAYVLKSPYDGSKIKLACSELIELIQHLKPSAVILPKNIIKDYPQIWESWNDSIVPFMNARDLELQELARPHGVYFNDLKLDQLDHWSHVPRYVVGDIDLDLMLSLRAQGIELIETDLPAKAAMQGKVFSRSGEVDLTDAVTQMQFAPIDEECVCPTCTQQLTKAYLYHLLQNTPLLCQRFLIQHNVFYAQMINNADSKVKCNKVAKVMGAEN